MNTVSMVKPRQPQVNYEPLVKGVEYPTYVAIFKTFPLFFKYVNKAPKTVTAKK